MRSLCLNLVLLVSLAMSSRWCLPLGIFVVLHIPWPPFLLNFGLLMFGALAPLCLPALVLSARGVAIRMETSRVLFRKRLHRIHSPAPAILHWRFVSAGRLHRWKTPGAQG